MTRRKPQIDPVIEDYESTCDRCLRTRMRSDLRAVKGRVTIFVCKEPCEFVS